MINTERLRPDRRIIQVLVDQRGWTLHEAGVFLDALNVLITDAKIEAVNESDAILANHERNGHKSDHHLER